MQSKLTENEVEAQHKAQENSQLKELLKSIENQLVNKQPILDTDEKSIGCSGRCNII